MAPATIKVGTKLRHKDGYLHHVRGIIDGLYITRYWSKKRRYWAYEIVTPYSVEIGLLTIVKQ